MKHKLIPPPDHFGHYFLWVWEPRQTKTKVGTFYKEEPTAAVIAAFKVSAKELLDDRKKRANDV
jgi:hypothetical protein